jgi:hypothetical protein
MSETCNRSEIHTKRLFQNLNGSTHLVCLDVDDRIILKWILKSQGGCL